MGEKRYKSQPTADKEDHTDTNRRKTRIKPFTNQEDLRQLVPCWPTGQHGIGWRKSSQCRHNLWRIVRSLVKQVMCVLKFMYYFYAIRSRLTK